MPTNTNAPWPTATTKQQVNPVSSYFANLTRTSKNPMMPVVVDTAKTEQPVLADCCKVPSFSMKPRTPQEVERTLFRPWQELTGNEEPRDCKFFGFLINGGEKEDFTTSIQAFLSDEDFDSKKHVLMRKQIACHKDVYDYFKHCQGRQ